MPVAGQQFCYTFDNIGNRTQTQTGGDQNGGSLRSANYWANNLNQYSSRDVVSCVDIKGISVATNTVTVNGMSVYRRSEYFRKEIPVSNGGSALWYSVTVAATGQGNVSGYLFVPQTPEQFSYDADGNLTQDGRWTYTWDAENRLVGMAVNTSAGPQYTLTFAYDPKGRRIQKVVATNGVTVYTDNFLYDGWNLIAEVGTSGSLVRSYVWGNDLSGSQQGAGGVGGLLEVSCYGSPTTNCFPAFDGNGNLCGLINAADGTTVARYEYGPFGEVIRSTGPMAKANPLRFSTEYQDDESDIIMYPLRPYSASTGRFLTHDPLGDAAFGTTHALGLNRKSLRQQALLPPYLFVRNNPINSFDLLGLYDNCCCDSQTIEDGKKGLIDAYNQAVAYLAPSRPPGTLPEDGPWSCASVTGPIAHFMSPAPHCWTCYWVDHWTKHWIIGDADDLNVVVCESHPQTGSPQKIVFDYWDLAPPAQDYSIYLKNHPDQRSPDVAFPADDCSKQHNWKANTSWLDAISNPGAPSHN
jgi:RHS repeat-associated protein